MPNFAIVEYTDADTDVDEGSTKIPTVTIWELPTPSRFGTQPTQHLTDYKPFRTWHMPAEFPGDLISVISWEKGLQEGTYFNRFKSDEETVTVLRHSVVPKYSEFADLMEPEIHNDPTIDLPRSTFGSLQENDLIELCTFPDGMRVLYWPAGAKLFMHFSHANDEFPPFHVSVGSQHPAFQQWYTHSIMVSIGRICVLDEGEVEIWELC
ncbi:hypothetical protein DL96DRAFT_1631347 [Flagelloscypha sp. PMI_526]|nr:hypothetical protein DL96DRAFT_1631347 [Flagelloscypha sp. PMI_526]